MKFNDVKFKIKEFESVDIISGYSLAFYLPKEEHMIGEENKNKNQKTKKDEYRINKSKSLEYIQKINEEKEKEIEKLKLQSNEKINEEFDKLKDDALPAKGYKRKDYEYDVFYDIYTSDDNIKNHIRSFSIDNGVATVTKDFLKEFYEKSFKNESGYKWCLIPRLICDKGESSFDPVPILNSSFVISELSNIKQKTLTFQRKIANVEHPNHFALQSPKVFKSMLENEQSFASYGGKEKQIKDLSKSAQYKLETIKKADGFSKKTKEALEKKQRKEVEKCKKLENNKKKISPKLIGDTGEYVTSLLFGKRSTRYLSNQRKLDANFNIHSFNHTIPDFLVNINGIPSLVEVKNVQVQSLTEQISFELKLAREYELDYIFVCNHYTHLTENVTGSVLTREEHEKLALDGKKVGEFNKETKRLKKTKVVEILNEKDKDKQNWSEVSNIQTSRLRIFSEKGGDCDARSGFIYHRHLHRSIKTAFKEIYLHHIKGATPNKIVIKRLNLNNAEELEEVFNENKNLQKS
ncbi:putative toxin [Campylobacter lari]